MLKYSSVECTYFEIPVSMKILDSTYEVGKYVLTVFVRSQLFPPPEALGRKLTFNSLPIAAASARVGARADRRTVTVNI